MSDNANKFADEVFHFEKRIVNSLPERRQPVILTLSEVQKLANSVGGILYIFYLGVACHLTIFLYFNNLLFAVAD